MYILVIVLRLVKQSSGVSIVSHNATKDCTLKWRRDVYYSQVLRKGQHTLRRHLERPRQGACRENAEKPGHVPLIGFSSGVLWSFRDKDRLVRLNQKEWGVGKAISSFFLRPMRGRPWEEKSAYHMYCRGSHIRNLHLFICDSADHILGLELMGRARVNLRPLQSAWLHKMNAEESISWSSLVKFTLHR